MITRIDIIEQREFARKQRFEEGRQEGILDVAKRMLASRLSLEQVRLFTGLTEQEI